VQLLTRDEMVLVAGGGWWDTLMCFLGSLFHGSNPTPYNGVSGTFDGGSFSMSCGAGSTPTMTIIGGGGTAYLGLKTLTGVNVQGGKVVVNCVKQ